MGRFLEELRGLRVKDLLIAYPAAALVLFLFYRSPWVLFPALPAVFQSGRRKQHPTKKRPTRSRRSPRPSARHLPPLKETGLTGRIRAFMLYRYTKPGSKVLSFLCFYPL